jgi:predicted DNA-binding transcriptional regulator AlpA
MPLPDEVTPAVVTMRDLLIYIGVSQRTLRRWIKSRHFPSGYKPSGSKSMRLFKLAEVNRWFDNIEHYVAPRVQL